MRRDLTDLTVVLDRSGSMAQCKDEAENGLDHFVKEQQKQPGKCNYTLVQFDNEYEFVHQGVDIKSVERHLLIPRGMTALLDAVGRAIAQTGERLDKMLETERPGVVIFVILTDGLENCSREYTQERVRAMITEQQTKYNWQFNYLGANQDAFAEAGALGIRSGDAANYKGQHVNAAFNATAQKANRMRGQAAVGQSIGSSYTNEERKLMVGDKSK